MAAARCPTSSFSPAATTTLTFYDVAPPVKAFTRSKAQRWMILTVIAEVLLTRGVFLQLEALHKQPLSASLVLSQPASVLM